MDGRLDRVATCLISVLEARFGTVPGRPGFLASLAHEMRFFGCSYRFKGECDTCLAGYQRRMNAGQRGFSSRFLFSSALATEPARIPWSLPLRLTSLRGAL